MPFLSKAQARWGFTDSAKKAGFNREMAEEFASHTDYKKLPAKKGSAKKRLAKHLAGLK